jgi:DNA-binding NtrC family response regulator
MHNSRPANILGSGAQVDPQHDTIEENIERLRRAQGLGKLVGCSSALSRVLKEISQVAPSTATVLISGQTGTGKELVARAIHYLSNRSAGAFVPMNCGSIHESLLEAELFGHERGAFTDARNKRDGLVMFAQNGTLLLDEVDTLSAKAQISILRVLQERQFRPVGSTREQPANVRFIAATNADLPSLVRSGCFRADLFYRLRIFTIHIAPLSDRPEDVIPLAHHFLLKHCAGGAIPSLSAEAQTALLRSKWPGNVRELENAIIRASILCNGSEILPEHLGLSEHENLGPSPFAEPQASNGGRFKSLKRDVIAAFERDYLFRLLLEHDGNITKAARVAGKDRRDLGKLMKKYGLNARQFVVQSIPPAT